MKQCILTVATWLLHSEGAPTVTLNLGEQYPAMEAQGPIPELLRKVLTAYETVSTFPCSQASHPFFPPQLWYWARQGPC